MRPMERRGDYDGEIGRGRQHDSSSSRESSPVQRPKRSFSPTSASDDGDAMAHEDDAITPSERPLLRQPLGFSIVQPAQSINTYEASVSAPTKNGVFLPGQEVPGSSKPNKSKAKKRSSGARRPRQPEAYAKQTSRFRLQTYDSTPCVEPHRSGPYSSVYRGVAPTTKAPDPPATAITYLQGRPSSSSNTMNSFGQFPSIRFSQQSCSAPKSKAAASKGKNTQPVACSKFEQLKNENTGSTSLAGPYYRHNYESQHKHATSLSPVPTSQRQLTLSDTEKKWSPIARSQRCPPAASTSSRGTDNEEAEGQPRKPLRIVTVLIQDIRSGVTDHQLAEVKIPLKPSDDPKDGFWADARDISKQLQASASRIDGPAKVYTLRGKYRQFFLRVSADNADEYISAAANVIIQPDRTLDVVVEMLQPPGAPPVVPKIPKELWPPRDDSEEPDDLIDVDPRRDKHITSSEGSRKRRKSPSSDDSDDYPDHYGDPYAYSSKAPRLDLRDMSPQVKPSRSALDKAHPKKRQSYAKEVIRQRSRSLEKSPLSMLYEKKEDPHEKQFILVVDNCLKKDRVPWFGFFEAKSGGNRVYDIVKQYEFLDRICATWVGKLVPGYDIPIEEHHVYKAMKIDDEEYLRYFKETIALLALYGKDGRRCEDTGIVALINDSQATKSPSTLDPLKTFLGALREVDAKWLTNVHPNNQHPPQRLDTPHEENRSTKALFV